MIKSEIYTFRYVSPCGDLLLGDYQGQLCLCDWCYDDRRKRIDARMYRLLNASYLPQQTPLIRETIRQLDEYFNPPSDDPLLHPASPLRATPSILSGGRRHFDLPLLLVGTSFQQRVWRALLEIPYGDTCSYATLARRLGYERGVQAIAQAVGANPLSIIIPCHRVIGSNGALVGYAGGLAAKRWLLEREGYERV